MSFSSFLCKNKIRQNKVQPPYIYYVLMVLFDFLLTINKNNCSWQIQETNRRPQRCFHRFWFNKNAGFNRPSGCCGCCCCCCSFQRVVRVGVIPSPASAVSHPQLNQLLPFYVYFYFIVAWVKCKTKTTTTPNKKRNPIISWSQPSLDSCDQHHHLFIWIRQRS